MRINKYKNRKVKVDGIMFDSIKEAKFYQILKEKEALGNIKSLELQKEYVLQDKFKINGKTIRKITYTADFTYYDNNDKKTHVIDVKRV